ncbi:hypothetical protein ACFU9W_48285, partial [Streptomyces sp. NPDC057600]|uniref:hypothetical protein n=1 Tax=Streptomyces sp. NPDC057600 TaxID=3346180 RepID=UPI00369DB1B0
PTRRNLNHRHHHGQTRPETARIPKYSLNLTTPATSLRAVGHHAELEVRRPCTDCYHTCEYLGLLFGELILLVSWPWWAGTAPMP